MSCLITSYPSPYRGGKRNSNTPNVAPPTRNFNHVFCTWRLKSCSKRFMPRVKYSDTKPHITPNMIYQGKRSTKKGSLLVNGNMASCPFARKDMAVAVTDDISNGAIRVIVRSIISTSNVNTKPAMGAWKIPPIAPAAPQPIISIMVFWSRRKSLARLLPMAAPVITIGASAPTEPPKPIVNAEPTTEVHVLCNLMMDLRCEMA